MNAITPTMTHEIKYGRNIIDWDTFRNRLLWISVRNSATATCVNVPSRIKARLYKTVFLVTRPAWPDLKKNLKFSSPFQGLPQIPPV